MSPSDVKKKLMQEIEAKIAKRKALRAEILNKNIIDTFVLAFIKNVEDINTMVSDQREWQAMVKKATNTLLDTLKSYDEHCRIDISWHTADGELPQVNGVLIKWSKTYQDKNSCDPELFVDVTSLIFS